MYIIDGIDESTKFHTLTRFEIGKIDWIAINDIEDPS